MSPDCKERFHFFCKVWHVNYMKIIHLWMENPETACCDTNSILCFQYVSVQALLKCVMVECGIGH